MRRQLVDLSPVHSLALEHGRCVMRAVGHYMHRRLAPGHELAVQPDPSIAVVEGNERHLRAASFQEASLETFEAGGVKQIGPAIRGLAA